METNKAKLIIRLARAKDINEIIKLGDLVYPNMPPYTRPMLKGQLNAFPEGQFLAEYDGKIVGYCCTFIVDESMALKKHSWNEITGGGFSTTHDEQGTYLYGADIFVDPSIRGMRIGKRLYKARKDLCKSLKLKGILFGARIPGYGRRKKKFKSVEEYIQKVEDKSIRDSTLSFQLANGFEVLGVLKDYLPYDKASGGYAAHMMWRNPEVSDEQQKKRKYGVVQSDTVRVGTVQYKLRRVSSFEEFSRFIEYFVDVVSDYGGDFVVFPEMFPLQLLSMEPNTLSPNEAIEALTKYTPKIKKLLNELSLSYNINIIGGSHPTKTKDGHIRNICSVFLRDGSIHTQEKIHPTPNERYWWNIQGGDEVEVIQTDCGPIGVLICYDSEFPELARHLVNQGAKILFVPFCTDERQSYLRVRYCCQARAVENQCYVVMSGNVGNLPGVENMDIQYAQSCILTPCDTPFSRDGIAADTTPNSEMVAFADLKMNILNEARTNGTVQNLKDRRFDLYEVDWKKT